MRWDLKTRGGLAKFTQLPRAIRVGPNQRETFFGVCCILGVYLLFKGLYSFLGVYLLFKGFIYPI